MNDQRPHPSAAKSWSQFRSTPPCGVSQCFNVDFIPGKWGGVTMRHAVEKTVLVAQPVQPVALTSPVACCQSAISKWRPESTKAGRQRCEKAAPQREVSLALIGTQRCQIASKVGCLLGLWIAAPLQKVIDCMQGPCEKGETGKTLES